MLFRIDALSTVTPPGLPLGWAITLAVAALLLGGGGVAAIVKAYYDRRDGIESHEIAEDDAVVQRWRDLTEAQVSQLLVPMQTELARLDGEVKALRLELDNSRRKYWSAIPYIRTLLAWINRHMPEGVPTVPSIPASIAEDI